MPAIKIHQQIVHQTSYFEKGPEFISGFSEIGKLAKILSRDDVDEISFKQITAVKTLIFDLSDHISSGSLSNTEIISKWMSFLRSLVFRMYRYTVKMTLNCSENKILIKNKMSKTKFRTMQALIDEIIRKIEELPE